MTLFMTQGPSWDPGRSSRESEGRGMNIVKPPYTAQMIIVSFPSVLALTVCTARTSGAFRVRQRAL
ncbi:hypothetical protein BD310DRAFT_931378 [Dichomitus squalens]|uniref:Uncharacterized protein n=1 Tax=Dichomitus squalens TaxID=114155 RepID=A0A4Q9PQM4_9APHY|nr:hypothetical protein BD310DRAFT_931378 [Dichomitus squalens]